VPLSGNSNPVMILSKVDFPAPFGPKIPVTEFLGISSEMSLKTVFPE
jgi:hypothetical protein